MNEDSRTRIDFSEKALAELGRAGQSCVLTSVRARWTWILFAVVAAFFCALIWWGFFGSIVSSVSGQGILLARGGVHPIIAGGSGMLTQLSVRMGSQVRDGQVLGQIHNSEQFFQLRKLEAEYEQLRGESDALTAGSRKMTELRLALERERETALASLTEKYNQSLARSRKLSQNYQTLKGLGAASMADYFGSLDKLLGTEAQLLSNRLDVMLSSAQMREVEWEQRRNLVALESRLLQKGLEVELARKLFRETFWLTAGFDGRITELLKGEGDFVRQGDVVALVSSGREQGFLLIGFLSVEAGKQVRAGMSAYFAPSSVRPNEYGYILGVVREVSEAPVSAESVLAELRNAGLAQAFSGGGAVIRVAVELLPDDNAVSGLRWTSRTGAPVRISGGVTGSLIVNTEYRTPASYLVPGARSALFGR